MTEKPSYYSMITADVRYDKRLSADEKLLFSEITALTESTGICWASNSYFARLYEVTTETISRRISKLKKYGYISTKIIYKPKSKEIDKRLITLMGIDNSVKGYCVETQGGIDNSVNRGIDAKRKENTTSNEYYKFNNITPKVPFDDFWEAYPNKVGKASAKTKYEKKVKDLATHNLIMKDLEKRKYFHEWIKDGGRYIPHPTTYLNNERWNDEYQTTQQNQTLDLIAKLEREENEEI